MTDRKITVTTRKHYSKSGECFTQEIRCNGAACVEIITDSTGRQIDTSGSGGWRPWHL